MLPYRHSEWLGIPENSSIVSDTKVTPVMFNNYAESGERFSSESLPCRDFITSILYVSIFLGTTQEDKRQYVAMTTVSSRTYAPLMFIHLEEASSTSDTRIGVVFSLLSDWGSLGGRFFFFAIIFWFIYYREQGVGKSRGRTLTRWRSLTNCADSLFKRGIGAV